MQFRRIIRLALVSGYGGLLALGRPAPEAVAPSAPALAGLIGFVLLLSIFFLAPILGLWVALGAGSWWRRLMIAFVLWLAVLALYFVGCGSSQAWTQGDVSTPATVYSLIFTALLLGLARRRWGWQFVDLLAPGEVAPARRQFTLAQLLMLIPVVGACCGILQVAVRETRLPSGLSWRHSAAMVLPTDTLIELILFSMLVLPWMLAALDGWKGAVLAVITTLVTAGAILAYVFCLVVPRAGPRANDVIAIAVIGPWLPALPAYLILLAFRWLGFRMQWRRTDTPDTPARV